MWHQVAFPAAGHHRPSTSTKLYCLVTEAHACEQLAEDCYLKVEWPTVKSFESQVQCPKHYTTRPHNDNTSWILIVKNPRTFHKSGMRGAHYSGVLLKMEVGIRKGAWQRAWRYPAYLWPLRWVYAVKKNPEVGIRHIPAYTPQYTTDHRQRQRQVDTINTECWCVIHWRHDNK